MPLSAERHEEVDAELQRIHDFFVALAAEIKASSTSDQSMSTSAIVAATATQVTHLRRLLELEPKKPKHAPLH